MELTTFSQARATKGASSWQKQLIGIGGIWKAKSIPKSGAWVTVRYQCACYSPRPPSNHSRHRPQNRYQFSCQRSHCARRRPYTLQPVGMGPMLQVKCWCNICCNTSSFSHSLLNTFWMSHIKHFVLCTYPLFFNVLPCDGLHRRLA